MDNSPSPQYWNVGYDYNTQTFSHKVFGEYSDKKMENVVSVEALRQTSVSMKPKDECKDITVKIKTEDCEFCLTRVK